MRSQSNPAAKDCPVTQASVVAEAKAAFDNVLAYGQQCEATFALFEKELWRRIAVLGCCLIRLFLTARHERCDLQPYLEDGGYRPGDHYAQRTLKTFYGKVTYGRQYLMARRGGSGFCPLDVVLGLTRDRLTPWVLQWVARLATRMSFQAAHMTCQAVLTWAPATETIEQGVLGLGREAAAFMRQHPAAGAKHPDGEVLVIEIDGKCAPTATDEELAKRRGPRPPRHLQSCPCGCQRHRGRARRELRGSKKRRQRGDKSKHGREAVVVVMYTLGHGQGGQLHGPRNKKLYATFAGRKAAAWWARAQATKRGFGPDTPKTVQIVLDGAKSLQGHLQPLFPKAIFTLDVCHVVERLWALGRHYHPEGSAPLATWVEELKELVYGGHTKTLLHRLRELRDQVPLRGPGTKGRRKALTKLIRYVQPRQRMMRYACWMEQDLVIATGQVEGAVRHLVGERLDGSGMRWVRRKAEAVLQLRCIELNGDWEKFEAWFQRRTQSRLAKGKRHKILTNQPLPITKAA
jgi:hypothetical protein